MSYFIHKTQITSSDMLIEKLAERSIEMKRLQREADFGDPDTKKLARSKLYRITESVLEIRRKNNQSIY